MSREQRYWKVATPNPGPGEPIATHDGGVGISSDEESRSLVSGPGNYQVVVRAPGKTIAGGDTEGARIWPIELTPTGTNAYRGVVRFNPGMARWFGLRLIEAAAIWEMYSIAQQLGVEAEEPPTDTIGLKTLVVGRLRGVARKVIDEQSAPAAMEYRAVVREAVAADMITNDEIRREVVEYFTPNEQTILRGKVG